MITTTPMLELYALKTETYELIMAGIKEKHPEILITFDREMLILESISKRMIEDPNIRNQQLLNIRL